MPCEEEFNALRRAERELAHFRYEHPGVADGASVPAGGVPESASTDVELRRRLTELSAAVRDKRSAYDRCRGEAEALTSIESLMRDATGKPLGGGAGPPM